MGLRVVDVQHRQIELVFACKRLMLVENEDENVLVA